MVAKCFCRVVIANSLLNFLGAENVSGEQELRKMIGAPTIQLAVRNHPVAFVVHVQMCTHTYSQFSQFDVRRVVIHDNVQTPDSIFMQKIIICTCTCTCAHAYAGLRSLVLAETIPLAIALLHIGVVAKRLCGRTVMCQMFAHFLKIILANFVNYGHKLPVMVQARGANSLPIAQLLNASGIETGKCENAHNPVRHFLR